MLIVLINFLFFRERIGLLFALGIAFSLLGVAVTATHGDIFAIFTLSVNRGDALMMLAVLFYSGYSVALRNRPKLHWLSFMATLSVAALITTIPFAVYEAAAGNIVWPSLKGAAVGSILVGMVDTFGKALVPDLSYFTLFLPMAIVLAIKPSGLFGRA